MCTCVLGCLFSSECGRTDRQTLYIIILSCTRSEARFARLLLVCDLLSYIHWMNVGGQVKGSTENECYHITMNVCT